MKVKVEFCCGLALRLSREKAALIEVSDDATLRDVSKALAERFPAFLGPLIVPETYDLVKPHFFNVNGQRVAQSLDIKVKDNERLLLMSPVAGG
ncbi:MAG: MoaD/ThiS family protein [Chloroflexi bacterium]|nr:MoaD/ThiS family protein [Chloroflexota bacterium]